MRIFLFYLSQTLLGLTFFYLTYLPTIRIDFFKWGSSNTDGLYLLVVPFILLPTILLVSMAKYFVIKRMKLKDVYKLSILGVIASGLVSTIFVFVDALWPSIAISMATTIVIVIETFIISKQLLANRADA